jgi:hypothetical protein
MDACRRHISSLLGSPRLWARGIVSNGLDPRTATRKEMATKVSAVLGQKDHKVLTVAPRDTLRRW